MNFHRFKSRPRQQPVPGDMNKLEERYSAHLDLLKKAGQIVDFWFQPIKLRLAVKTFYTPDFLVVTKESIEVHETKGFWEDDARVKIKVAADRYWFLKFKAIKWVNKGWEVEEF